MRLKHARALLEHGRIRLGTLYGYRQIEGAPVGIADPLEGRIEGYINEAVILPGQDDDVARRMRAVGMYRGGSLWVLGGRVRCEIPNCYILCLSELNTPRLFGEDYDTIVGFSDVEAIAMAISRAEPERLGPARMGYCTYDDVEFDAVARDRPALDPFLKDRRFSGQREIRICWEARGGAVQPFLDVQSEELAAMYNPSSRWPG